IGSTTAPSRPIWWRGSEVPHDRVRLAGAPAELAAEARARRADLGAGLAGVLAGGRGHRAVRGPGAVRSARAIARLGACRGTCRGWLVARCRIVMGMVRTGRLWPQPGFARGAAAHRAVERPRPPAVAGAVGSSEHTARRRHGGIVGGASTAHGRRGAAAA